MNNKLEETKRLNKQSEANKGMAGAKSSAMTNAAVDSMTNNVADGSVAETKKLNQKSASRKGMAGADYSGSNNNNMQ